MMNVLLVAADSVPRAIVERTVAHIGHTVTVVRDGGAAWNALTENLYDMVICERHLRDTTALDLVRQARLLGQSRYVYFLVLTPHAEALRAVDDVREGADDSLFFPVDRAVLEARLIVASRVMSLHRRLYQQARSDALTGAANRMRFVEDSAVLMDRAQRYGEGFGLILCDIDNFKSFNDSYGHQAGDAALQAVAHALEDAVRGSDGVYRFGGEEFVAMLPRQDLDECRATAERLRRRVWDLRIPHANNDGWGRVSLSLGASEYRAGIDDSVDEVLARADAEMYRAKDSGRNCVLAEGDTAPTRSSDDTERADVAAHWAPP